MWGGNGRYRRHSAAKTKKKVFFEPAKGLKYAIIEDSRFICSNEKQMAVTFSTGQFGENKKDVLLDLGTQEHPYTPFYEHRSKTEKVRGNSKPRNYDHFWVESGTVSRILAPKLSTLPL